MPTPEQVETVRAQKADQAKRDAQQADSDLAWLMSDKRGRRFMWGLLEEVGVYRLSFVPGDTHLTAMCEGQRNVGLKLIARLNRACVDRMSEMQKEVLANVRPDSSTSSR